MDDWLLFVWRICRICFMGFVMTPEEKVAMLKEAGVWDVIGFPTCIDKLFELVAAHERERMKWDGIHTCSDVCDKPACVARRNAVLAERDKALEAARTVGGEFFVGFEKVYLK